ncbi:hypothetical protein FOHLNKBM_2360 [Methylobacterium longum]|nr:hypothetical protein [Methylobacterium longum]GJE11318.1 hypothetical protein FOHLNKBM_2360 [Methylobacterium longum]
MVSVEVLSVALRRLAVPGMTAKALRAALREKHPEASKKAIVRAAFLALIEAQSQDGQSGGCSVEALHGFALAERASGDDGPMMLSPRRRRQQRHVAAEAAAAAAIVAA